MAETSPPPPSIDAGIDALLHKAEAGVAHCLHDIEDYARESPLKALVGAAAFGYFLRNLPLRSILMTKVRVLAALAPPALVLYGAAKVYEFVQAEGCCKAPEEAPASPQKAG